MHTVNHCRPHETHSLVSFFLLLQAILRLDYAESLCLCTKKYQNSKSDDQLSDRQVVPLESKLKFCHSNEYQCTRDSNKSVSFKIYQEICTCKLFFFFLSLSHTYGDALVTAEIFIHLKLHLTVSSREEKHIHTSDKCHLVHLIETFIQNEMINLSVHLTEYKWWIQVVVTIILQQEWHMS